MLLILKDKRISSSGTEKTIEMLRDKLQQKSVPTQVGIFEDLEILIKQNEPKIFLSGENIKQYSTIFFRKVGKNRTLAFLITMLAQKYGINFFDRLYAFTNEPGKLKQTFMLALRGVSVPKTYFAVKYDDKKIVAAIDFLALPIVVKLSVSKKGQGVYLAHSQEDLTEILKKNKGIEVLLQEFIDNEFDYRILVLEKEIVCAEKRTRNGSEEFRNNVFLGAAEEFLEIGKLEQQLREIAVAAAVAVDIQIAGVDVVVGRDGKAYVFEVNRSPAFTHDDEISPELNKLAEFLELCEKRK